MSEGNVNFIFFLIFSLIFIMIPVVIAIDKTKQEKKKIEQERKTTQAREEYRKTMQKIIDFAKSNGFKDIEKMLKDRDNEFNSAMSYAFSTATTLIYKPSYSKGIKEGSLADNVAYLANIEKQKEYDKQVSNYRNQRELATEYSNKAYRIEKQIIKKLESIPESTTYVMLLQSLFDDSRNEYKKFLSVKKNF